MNPSAFSFLLALLVTISQSLVLAGKVTDPKKVPNNAILLSNVESLTLRSGRMTSSRRVSPVPQLTCAGPNEVCKLYEIDVMRCTNEGGEYEKEDIQWACKADLPEEFKLGATEVACEGYASSDDPYVLKGSCGVGYRLILTEKGEEKFGRHRGHDYFDGGNEAASTFAKVIFFGIFAVVLFIIVSRMLEACRRNPPRLGGGNQQPPWFGGGGGGGGDDGTDDPPPPYDAHGYGGPRKQNKPSTTRTYGTAGLSSSAGRQQQQQGWRPGPWSAGLAGAGLGYVLGRNQNRTQTQPAYRESPGFFGGGGGPSGTRPSGSAPRSPGPSFSSSRYESTGFGGTSRR